MPANRKECRRACPARPPRRRTRPSTDRRRAVLRPPARPGLRRGTAGVEGVGLSGLRGPAAGRGLAATARRWPQSGRLVLVPGGADGVAGRKRRHGRDARPGKCPRLAAHPRRRLARCGLPRRDAARPRRTATRGEADGGATGTVLGSPAPAPNTAETDPTPSLAAADPPAPAPSTAVPPALVALARKVADEHRVRTGTDIDTSTLRARLGVPLPLAEAIATQLI